MYSHSSTCKKRIVEQMQDDPEYRWLMKRHNLHQELGEVEILTKEQLNEKRHNMRRVTTWDMVKDQRKQCSEDS